MTRTPLNHARLAALCSKFRPGDLIAFQSRGFFSSLISFVQSFWKRKTYRFTHVGIVVETAPNSWPIIDESTAQLDLVDLVSGKKKSGSQRHSLLARMEAVTKGNVWWFPLSPPLSAEEQALMLEWLRRTLNASYDWNQVAFAGLDLLFKNKISADKLFCSERVAFALMAAGRLDPGFNPSECTPADLVSFPLWSEGVLIWSL